MSIKLEYFQSFFRPTRVKVFCSILMFTYSFYIISLGNQWFISESTQNDVRCATEDTVELVILGVAQDAGMPQLGCEKDCCRSQFANNNHMEVVSIGLRNYEKGTSYIFEATPDFVKQMHQLHMGLKKGDRQAPDGIFLTHAHIGHYTGLMYLGKESMNANGANVYVMPQMYRFLELNQPWRQLLAYNNIELHIMSDGVGVQLDKDITVIPMKVPHRDEFSETVGYKIIGPKKKALFIPDIDKWSKWHKNIINEVKNVDYAFIDATFYSGEEIKVRNISEIPHPFVIESMELFSELEASEKNKIYFIHMNHSNPLLQPLSKESMKVLELGYNIARDSATFQL